MDNHLDYLGKEDIFMFMFQFTFLQELGTEKHLMKIFVDDGITPRAINYRDFGLKKDYELG